MCRKFGKFSILFSCAHSLKKLVVLHSRQRLDKSVSLQVSDQLDRCQKDFQELEEKYRCAR